MPRLTRNKSDVWGNGYKEDGKDIGGEREREREKVNRYDLDV